MFWHVIKALLATIDGYGQWCVTEEEAQARQTVLSTICGIPLDFTQDDKGKSLKIHFCNQQRCNDTKDPTGRTKYWPIDRTAEG